MLSKINFFLLVAVTLSALYLVDLRNGLRRETQLFGKGQEEDIRLRQDAADLQYQYSRLSDKTFIGEAAKKMDMHTPVPQETIIAE